MMSRRKAASATTNINKDVSQNIVPASPTGVHEVRQLQQLLDLEREKGALRDETIKILKDDKAFLQGELSKKDEFIRNVIIVKKEQESGPSCSNVKQMTPSMPSKMDISDQSADDSDETSALSDSSIDSAPKRGPVDLVLKRGPEKRKRCASKHSPSHRDGKAATASDMLCRVRVRNTRSIIARYKLALQAFKQGNSMRAAFDSVGLDRTTIARTAPVAELHLAAPDVLKGLGPWNEKVEKLSSFVERCRSVMTTDIKNKISQMKIDGELLPIAGYK
ncbi:coiled-coil domain-containing protein 106-like [Esox lucius]|uniref:coiled-coil domain-containing protein 106-like n=1 Tax=Esox lucius TaxID=8010 RepID=UPI001476CF4B|nr:coiled-coil domain-containing protein 106-like [Esox lucius]XP_034142595.1 coiled-coil domain-containing protein 106-like [Esox lucius]XP_034142596.1 coiled-coil domain-containing protein 106-like [Esox lucius]